jgi:hypothetical protein
MVAFRPDLVIFRIELKNKIKLGEPKILRFQDNFKSKNDYYYYYILVNY